MLLSVREEPAGKDGYFYAGIILISVSTLLLQITLTRIFSVVQWHHFAFFVISMSLLGFGASGTFLTVFTRWQKMNFNSLLVTFSILFSLSIISSFRLVNYLPFDLFRILWDPRQFLYLALDYFLLALPFFFSGLILGASLSKIQQKVNIIYFFNLLGSAAGCLLVIALFSFLKGSQMIALSALGGGIAAFVFSLEAGRKKIFIPGAGGLIFSLIIFLFSSSILPIKIIPYKTLPTVLKFPDTKVLYTRWNPISRLDVVSCSALRYAPGLSFQFSGKLPPQLGIIIDGDSLTMITQYQGSSEQLEFLDYLTSTLPYYLKSPAKVLVIGAGGGFDLLNAISHGAQKVVGVEINPDVVKIVREKFGDLGGNLYLHPKVKILIGEGRSILRRSRENYDIIQISLLDSYAAASAGVYSLTENYLYTVEAFNDYWEGLTSGGILSITRWLLLPPRDVPRLVAIGLEVLKRKGITDAENYLAVIRGWGTVTFLLKKGPFSRQEVEQIRQFCEERAFDLVYYPGIRPEEVNRYNKLPEPYYYQIILQLIQTPNHQKFYQDYYLNLTPATDDRPFFYHFFKWRKLKELYYTVGRRWEPLIQSGDFTLIAVLLQALFFSFLFILVPLFCRRIKPEEGHDPIKLGDNLRGPRNDPMKSGSSHYIKPEKNRIKPADNMVKPQGDFIKQEDYVEQGRDPIKPENNPIYQEKDSFVPRQETNSKLAQIEKIPFFPVLTYFFAIGIGYMFLEIALIQKFILFLGHPLYSTSIIIFSLLLSSGVGSYFSDRIQKYISPAKFLMALTTLILLNILIMAAGVKLFLGYPLAFRIAYTSANLALPGFFMGVPFPMGVQRTGKINPSLIPWGWAVNGCASVLSAILAVIIALYTGFTVVIILAAAGYFLAGLASLKFAYR